MTLEELAAIFKNPDMHKLADDLMRESALLKAFPDGVPFAPKKPWHVRLREWSAGRLRAWATKLDEHGPEG